MWKTDKLKWILSCRMRKLLNLRSGGYPGPLYRAGLNATRTVLGSLLTSLLDYSVLDFRFVPVLTSGCPLAPDGYEFTSRNVLSLGRASSAWTGRLSAGRKLNKQSARHPVDDRGQSCAGPGLSRRSLAAYDSSGHERTRVSLNKVGPEYATRTNALVETSKGTTRGRCVMPRGPKIARSTPLGSL